MECLGEVDVWPTTRDSSLAEQVRPGGTDITLTICVVHSVMRNSQSVMITPVI